MTRNPYFPFFINLQQKSCLIIGAGSIGIRRIQSLAYTGIRIHLIYRDVALEYRDRLDEWNHRPGFSASCMTLQREELKQILNSKPDFVIAATDDAELNAAIGAACREEGILVNVASDRSLSDFYFPAVIQEDEVVIGVAGDGSDHKKVARISGLLRRFLADLHTG